MVSFSRKVAEWVYNLIFSFVRNKEDAEELTQDTIIEALNSMKKFRKESNIKTWVVRIAINKCKDHIKYHKRQKRAGVVLSLHEDIEGRFNREPVESHHPGVQLEHKEDVNRLMKGIDSLSENQKTALILAKFDHQSQAEVAEQMGLSKKAVESLISRAKANLKQYLLEQDFNN